MACSLLDLDEAWAFCGKKGGRVTEKGGPDVGEQWVWAVIDRLSKFVVIDATREQGSHRGARAKVRGIGLARGRRGQILEQLRDQVTVGLHVQKDHLLHAIGVMGRNPGDLEPGNGAAPAGRRAFRGARHRT